MQRELPKIDFTSPAEVRLQAEHLRTQEIAGLLKPMFKRRAAKLRIKSAIFTATHYAPVSARSGNQRLPQGRA